MATQSGGGCPSWRGPEGVTPSRGASCSGLRGSQESWGGSAAPQSSPPHLDWTCWPLAQLQILLLSRLPLGVSL